MGSTLPSQAQPTWSAYRAMAVTKKRHLDYLMHLEEKYQKYGQPSAEEESALNELLQEHDHQVKTFKTALQTLKISDPKAYAALIIQLAE